MSAAAKVRAALQPLTLTQAAAWMAIGSSGLGAFVVLLLAAGPGR